MANDKMRIWDALGKTRGCFWCLVDTSNPDSCWLWRGRTNYSGYGLFSKYRAHRVSWVLTYSEIPDGMCICHRCDVRSYAVRGRSESPIVWERSKRQTVLGMTCTRNNAKAPDTSEHRTPHLF